MNRMSARAVSVLVALSFGGSAALPVWAQEGLQYYSPDGAQDGRQDAVPSYDRRQIRRDLAPIALYPDQLLSQILMAATYPLEVAEAADWVRDPRNSAIRPDDLSRALEQIDWDPSVKALVPFPQVLQLMNDQPDWMQRVGEQFLAQQDDVMDAVQDLRREAYEAGTLRSDDRLAVRDGGPGIVIEPAQPDVVYVPYYDPRVAYGVWDYPDDPPIYFPPPPDLVWDAGIIYFGLAFFAPTPIVRPLWDWCAWDWRRRAIVIHRPHYVALNLHREPRWRGDVWQHDGYHRRGATYQAAAVRARWERGDFGPRDFNRDRRFEGAAQQFARRSLDMQQRRQREAGGERRQLADIQRRPDFQQQVERMRGNPRFGQRPQGDRPQPFDGRDRLDRQQGSREPFQSRDRFQAQDRPRFQDPQRQTLFEQQRRFDQMRTRNDQQPQQRFEERLRQRDASQGERFQQPQRFADRPSFDPPRREFQPPPFQGQQQQRTFEPPRREFQQPRFEDRQQRAFEPPRRDWQQPRYQNPQPREVPQPRYQAPQPQPEFQQPRPQPQREFHQPSREVQAQPRQYRQEDRRRPGNGPG